MNLTAIRDALLAEHLHAVYQAAPPMVNVGLDVRGLDEPLTLQITQVDTTDAAAPDVTLLQFFVGLPVELDAAAAHQTTLALPTLNLTVPLMGFNYHPDAQIVYFRYVLVVHQDTPLEVIAQTAWLVFFILDHWTPTLIGLATGQISADELLA